MTVDLPATTLAAYAVEAVIFLSGVYVWRTYQFSVRTAALRRVRVAEWRTELSSFFVVAGLVIGGAFVGTAIVQGVLALLRRAFAIDATAQIMAANLGLHLGAIAGVAIAYLLKLLGNNQKVLTPSPSAEGTVPLSRGTAAKAGVLTFLAAIPVVTLAAFAWQQLLELFGVKAEKQEMLELFIQEGNRGKLALMIGIAVIVAPVMEELVFRAGLFRFMRTRMPPWLAHVLAAAMFSALHATLSVSLPLFVLGLLFSHAYQRTGRPLSTMVAHGLFNLHTIVLVLLGVTN